MTTKYNILVVGVLSFCIGAGLGSWYSNAFVRINDSVALTQDVRDRFTQSQFTNPLLECAEVTKPITIGARINLEDEVTAFVESEKKAGHISEAAVYYRDLNNGPWFGVHEDLVFYPASLLKIPLAMWFYWVADSDPAILDEEIQFVGPPGVSIVNFKPTKSIQIGETYTIEELIQYMLQESDNDAAHILNEFAGQTKTQRVYADLGVTDESGNTQYQIDVRTYSAFFRVLYNATYLGRALSEHMLKLMSTASFREGIVAGVPAGTVVSHKFGEKILNEQGTEFQLHDCGIVYAPKSPYILCIMTQGTDIPRLTEFISAVSKKVYDTTN